MSVEFSFIRYHALWNMFDIIVIGGGAAGCYTCDLLKERLPSASVLLLEGNDRLGGRTETISFRGHKVDIGGQVNPF